MKIRAMSFVLFCLSVPVCFGQTFVPSGRITSGDIKKEVAVTEGTVRLGDATYGIAKGKLLSGRVIAGMVSGTLHGRRFQGKVTGATVENAELKDLEINQFDAQQNKNVPAKYPGPTTGLRLTNVTLPEADVEPSVVVIGTEGSVPAKGTTFEGDSIVVGVTVGEFTAFKRPGIKTTVPPGTKFRVVDERDDSGTTYLYGAFGGACRWFYGLPHLDWVPFFGIDPWFDAGSRCDVSNVVSCDEPGNDDAGKVCGNHMYQIRKDALQTIDHDRFGFTYGLMVVPFKAFVFNDWSISTGATIGPYLGYQVTVPGRAHTFALSTGISSIPITTRADDGSETRDTQTALSLAIGYLVNIKEAFNMGVFLGRDRLSKSSQYQYNNKTWLGIHIGYDLGK